ncbi:cation:H+ antiporter [Eubacterium uniforme]|uniref:Cation:H+ antiporter n=1 Tax=Eubacterium uniforme TaxID=39495 RepID=A0A1T4W4X4_9FIRM|nr:calcium/sodium antiporter [Eubacterium uniforme]SKA72283.1 cation:H+ antiporter [Eubacterium uniforme]
MIVIKVLLLCVGFALLIKGADWFVDGCAGIANKFGIPQIVIGLTIVAMGTSAPETAVSITAALKNNAGISVGNAIGSNILNILIILGITSLIIPLRLKNTTLKYEIPFMLIISITLIVMGSIDNYISRPEGIILWILFIGYLTYLFFLSKNNKADVTNETKESTWKLLAFAVLGVITIVLGSNISVNAATAIAKKIGISERIIGLTIVALGTSLPELVTSITAAKGGNDDIAIGNIIGSNIFNILFVIGTSSIIIPIKFQQTFILDGMVSVLAGASLLLLTLKHKQLNRLGGIILLSEYTVYLTYLICDK